MASVPDFLYFTYYLKHKIVISYGGEKPSFLFSGKGKMYSSARHNGASE